jgi:SGNH domain (fused to AT3 domains)
VPSPLDAPIEPNAPCEPLERSGLVAPCGFGIDPAVRSLALIGDSHAEHWRAAVQVVADAEGRRGLSITRTSCPLTTAKTTLPGPARADCARWNREVPRWLARHPAVSTVLVSENTDALIAPSEQVAGYMGAWKALPSSVKRVIVLRDSAHRALNATVCIERAMARHRRAGLACAVSRDRVLASDPAATAAARLRSRRVRVVDLNRFMCSERLCYPVVGGALVHKDGHHLTAVFARTLGPYLLREVGRAPVAAPARAPSIVDAARPCPPPRYPGSGYFTSLTVNGTSCATGRKLMLAYYRCRLRHGRAGRCHSTVLGYSCKETRNAIPTEINARVTCKRGRRSIVHTYQQNT